MQTAAGLLAVLGDSIEAEHLATMDRLELQALLRVLPSRSSAGSAEMMMTVLVYRDLEKRGVDEPPGELH